MNLKIPPETRRTLGGEFHWLHLNFGTPSQHGHLFPVNERATKTISNLYLQNERVVLEGQWQEGFMAVAAVGATNMMSIELFIEPELRTNRPRKKLLLSEPPEERIYEPEGVGVMLHKCDEGNKSSCPSSHTPIARSTHDNQVLPKTVAALKA
ncbi:Phosphatidylserine decarboxylase-related [Dillenia turbinata]|uniref:Phosphatidylserine decarboxylase-related n=1 Tax=Dillenia turbinata TaxID=194707 RepID=A0AAN8ZC83_9MAGN